MERLSWMQLLCSAFLVLCVIGCTDRIELHHALAEGEANEIIAELSDKGVNAYKVIEKEGITVTVDTSDMATAVHILQAAGLPRQSQTSFGEVFQKDGVISTPMEERARYLYALSQELEYTLSQIDGVVKARVHVVLPERIAPGEAVQPSSAAVFIKHQAWLDPDTILPRVERMVAKSIPGLSNNAEDKLAVIFVVAKEYAQRSESRWGDPVLTSENKWIYAVIILVLLVLVLSGGILFYWLKITGKWSQLFGVTKVTRK